MSVFSSRVSGMKITLLGLGLACRLTALLPGLGLAPTVLLLLPLPLPLLLALLLVIVPLVLLGLLVGLGLTVRLILLMIESRWDARVSRTSSLVIICISCNPSTSTSDDSIDDDANR